MARLNEEFKLMDFWNTGQARAEPLLLAVKAVTLARKGLLLHFIHAKMHGSCAPVLACKRCKLRAMPECRVYIERPRRRAASMIRHARYCSRMSRQHAQLWPEVTLGSNVSHRVRVFSTRSTEAYGKDFEHCSGARTCGDGARRSRSVGKQRPGTTCGGVDGHSSGHKILTLQCAIMQ